MIAARYIQTLNKLCRALREKRPKKKTVILQHDNARPHIARMTLQTIQKKSWEILSHPPYIPDLAPRRLSLVRALERAQLRGHHCETDEAVQEAGTDFYSRGIFKILQRWQKCTDRDRDFVEK
jgi:histone-lysine N-methyltransferase SETMAR